MFKKLLTSLSDNMNFPNLQIFDCSDNKLILIYYQVLIQYNHFIFKLKYLTYL